jgi:hypothetical protein
LLLSLSSPEKYPKRNNTMKHILIVVAVVVVSVVTVSMVRSTHKRKATDNRPIIITRGKQ